MAELLKIENLDVDVGKKPILKGVDLEIRVGETQALLGPNASGKSTLAYAIAGLPNYQIKKGKIFFEQREINKLSPEKRSQLGIALAWQSPPTIKELKLFQLLKRISKRKFESESLGLTRLLKREINLGFSGGEKKLTELLQVLSLNPRLVILDEIDSGLDLKRLEKVAKIIKGEFVNKGVSILLITHSGAILQYLKPEITNVMIKGKIICKEENYKKVLKTIKKYGYEKCKKCQLLAN